MIAVGAWIGSNRPRAWSGTVPRAGSWTGTSSAGGQRRTWCRASCIGSRSSSAFTDPGAAASTCRRRAAPRSLPFLVFPDDIGGTCGCCSIVAVGRGGGGADHGIVNALRYRGCGPGRSSSSTHSATGRCRSSWATTRRWCCCSSPASWPSTSPIGPPWPAVLLGIAIATKLWPAALLVVLARERDWRAFGWAAGTAAAITVVLIIWLGGRAHGPHDCRDMQVEGRDRSDAIRARHHLAPGEHRLVAGLGRLRDQPRCCCSFPAKGWPATGWPPSLAWRPSPTCGGTTGGPSSPPCCSVAGAGSAPAPRVRRPTMRQWTRRRRGWTKPPRARVRFLGPAMRSPCWWLGVVVAVVVFWLCAASSDRRAAR